MISRPDLWPEQDDLHRGSAPELVRSHKPGKHAARITKASDMYAFGMLTWEVGTISSCNLRSQFARYNARHILDLLRRVPIFWRSR